MEKITFITTIYNEEKTIDRFLDSLLQQKKMPDEIVIVDGGSVDKTVESLKLKVKSYGSKFKIFTKPGNRSVGRNFAIENATHEIIVCSDAGCILDKDFVKNIVEPFNSKDVLVVSGFYKPVTENTFEKALAAYTCVMEDQVDSSNFLPSSRSIAFRKTAWEKVGGYPEYLDTCEDLVFARNLKKAGLKFVFVKNALVFWPQRKSFIQAFKQFFSYAMGDGQARYVRFQTPFLFARYLGGLLLFIIAVLTGSLVLFISIGGGLIVYFLWAIQKNYRYVNSWKAFYILPLLQIISDIAVISGMTIGFIKSINR